MQWCVIKTNKQFIILFSSVSGYLPLLFNPTAHTAMPVYTVRDDSFPFLMLGSEKKALPWSYGSLHSIAAAGLLLRVSPRGLQVNRMRLAHRAGMGLPWHLDTCIPSPRSLCDTAEMRWFPTDIVDVSDDWGQLQNNAFMRLVSSTDQCRSAESALDINVFDTHYDVSLCDTLDRTLDVVVFASTAGETQR